MIGAAATEWTLHSCILDKGRAMHQNRTFSWHYQPFDRKPEMNGGRDPFLPAKADRPGNKPVRVIATLTTAVLLLMVLMPCPAICQEKADFVLVVKSESTLYLKREGKTLKKFSVVFGADPMGPKQKRGDKRTPEGCYMLDYKKADSAFYKAIHISYPNALDRRRAEAAGVDPGGLIMIHGQKNGFAWLQHLTQQFNWTNGCIAASNQAMDEIWQAVDVGTPIEIKP
jgi:murein L,D-transpeptidase YafK